MASVRDSRLLRRRWKAPRQDLDGGGSERTALVGGNLAALAVKNGWAGIVVDGCVRDCAELAACAEAGTRAGGDAGGQCWGAAAGGSARNALARMAADLPVFEFPEDGVRALAAIPAF